MAYLDGFVEATGVEVTPMSGLSAVYTHWLNSAVSGLQALYVLNVRARGIIHADYAT